MKAEDFINQQIKAGYKIHFHQGVWWEKVNPFIYKPVLPLQKIFTGKSKPKLAVSFLGYSHCVPEGCYANKVWSVMEIDYDCLSDFSIKSLSSSKRGRVRKGLRLLEFKKIEDVESVIDDIKNVCISTAKRTKHGKSPHYYVKHYKEWKSFMINEFSLPQREWCGVFYKDILIAYLYGYQIDNTMVISATKSHSDFLNKCPNDALLFTFLEYCKSLPGCKKVFFGDYVYAVPSLNEFKKKYGFEKVNLPVYANYNPLVRLAIKFLRK